MILSNHRSSNKCNIVYIYMCIGILMLPLSLIFLLDFRTGPCQCGIFCFLFLSCFSLLFTEIVCYQASLNVSQPVTSINNNKVKYVFHENVTISCKPGYNGKSTTAMCTDVNKWSIATPVCTSKYLIWNIIS
jgi:hypothetical protein